MSKDNFDLVRLLLAFGILLVHAAGITDTQELNFIFNYLTGDTLVKCFFVISGYLVTKSYYRDSGVNFFIKRALRVFPAYLFVVFAAVCMGAIITSYSLGEFFSNKSTLRYILFNTISLNFLADSLPGVFVHNPLRSVDGSLWTIKSEIILYSSMPFYHFLFKRVGFTTFFIIFLGAFGWVYYFLYVHHTPSRVLAMQFVGLALYYYGGVLFASLKNEKKAISFTFLYSLGLHWLISFPLARFLIEPALVVSGILFICLALPCIANLQKIGDLSYGIYLYNFPVIQVICNYGFFKTSPYTALLLSTIFTIGMALFSWNIIEKKSLSLKTRLTIPKDTFWKKQQSI
ncbi:acyltransferase family protein [Citrobacter sp. FP75]|uniref:acyltransferase family protein n=1 Tax=Citrobacter sp. FP75 TaxID=1852949 RepID=UPI001BC9D41F|nr:acyltransferase [Citrobacter sp. FP75]